MSDAHGFTARSRCVYCGRELVMLFHRPGVWVEWKGPTAPNTEHCYSYIDPNDNMRLHEQEHFAKADLPLAKTPEALERWLQT